MNSITKLLTGIRDFVLPGTFGKGKRASFTGVVATIYQLIIYGIVTASIYNSFMLYLRYGRINSFLTIYSDLNGIETPSLIYCKNRLSSGKKSSVANLKVLMRIQHRNKYYYSDSRNIRVCNYEDANCLCIDTWKQTYYNFDKTTNNRRFSSNSTPTPRDFKKTLNEIRNINLDNISIFPPGEFPIHSFMKNELDYSLGSTISMGVGENENIKYKPHLINWCDLNLPDVDPNTDNTTKVIYSPYDSNSTGKRNLKTKSNYSIKYINSKDQSKLHPNNNIYCEKKDMVEFLLISENELDQGIIGFYTSRQDMSTEPMWVKTSFPGVIFAFLQLEKNWIIDFYIFKLFFYHKLNPFNYLIKFFSRKNSNINISNNNKNNNESASIYNYNDNDISGNKYPSPPANNKTNVNSRIESKQNAYFVSESHQLVADIAQIHNKVLPENWLEWMFLHNILPSLNGNVTSSESISQFTENYLKNTDYINNVENNYSTLWVRAEYQLFFTPNTVRVANKHFLLKTFGLIMSIIFSLNYLNLFYSVFPFYRGETPKLTVSPLMKFLSCNLLNSYHE
ncbi:hypothetical protein FG379_000808 [Cryptosporidium bovis]|uniref:uncharacterized protein n=1 Tax=Cryptosporidium bovis TaxID=310047 RepID=UPI003519FF89|nr:hypothetical protein FG379_000808 [Cryptosporidium bovis]